MDRRKITFLVVSDRKGVTHRFVFSAAVLKTSAVVFGVLFVILAAAGMDYLGLLVQSLENKHLKAQNQTMKAQFKQIESKVEALEAGMERVRTFTTKIKNLMDVNEEDRVLKLSMGANSMAKKEALDEMDQPMENRLPASKLSEDENNFLNKPLLDIRNGELAAVGGKDYASLSVRIDRDIKATALREQSVLELMDLLASRQSLLRATPSIAPASGWLNSRFGYRVNPVTGVAILHQGLDFSASPGTPVHAVADGVISFAGWDETYGKLVTIDHGYGMSTRYGHNSQLYVVPGQKIRRGDVISAVGSTGRSTGPHVHYEVRLNDVPVDPANFILSE